MTIALITDGIFPNVIGGMQRHSYYLAKFLAASGVRVDLYHTIPQGKVGDPLEGFTESEKLNIRSFVVKFPSLGNSPGHYIRESYSYSVEIWNIFKKQSKVDFIIIKGFSGWELINQKSKGEILPPIALNFHGYEMFQDQPDFFSALKSKLILKSPAMFNMKNADYLFSYGAKITSLLVELGFSKNNILEIPSGISEDWLCEKYKPSEKLRKVVFSGRYERRKGVKELSAAISKILVTNKNCEFHFIGPIPPKKQIVSDRVIYHGLVSGNAEMKILLRGMDVLVCPSYAEGMPNVVLEAMASGVAVIATDTGATSIMINNSNGWLFAPKNQKQLLTALSEAIELPSLALDQKKDFCRNDISAKFVWGKIIDQTILVIDEKLKKSNFK